MSNVTLTGSICLTVFFIYCVCLFPLAKFFFFFIYVVLPHVGEIKLYKNFSSFCRQGAEYCDEHVCLSVSVCPRAYLGNFVFSVHHIFTHVTDGRGSVLGRCCDTLYTSDSLRMASRLHACWRRRGDATRRIYCK